MSEPRAPSSKLSVWLVAAILFLIAIAVGNAWVNRRQDVPVPVEPASISQFFAAKLTDTSGQTIDLSTFKGKPLVVNFWASWCPPCVAEMPELSKFYEQYRAKGVQMIGIAIDNPTAVKQFLQRHPVSYPVLFGGMDGPALSQALGNKNGGLPFTVVIDAKGDIVFQHLGQTNVQQLADHIPR